MSNTVSNKRHVKIFILYLMQNIRIPVDFATLTDMVRQTDYVMYLDLAECFHLLLDDGLLAAVPPAEGESDPKAPERYVVTPRGKLVADSMNSELRPAILDEALRCALRYLDFRQNGVRIHCAVTPNADGTAEFVCSVEQNGTVLFETRVNVDTVARAQRMEENFRARPEAIYRGMWSLLCGNVNYLFD